jgi:hypothetical protein
MPPNCSRKADIDLMPQLIAATKLAARYSVICHYVNPNP